MLMELATYDSTEVPGLTLRASGSLGVNDLPNGKPQIFR